MELQWEEPWAERAKNRRTSFGFYCWPRLPNLQKYQKSRIYFGGVAYLWLFLPMLTYFASKLIFLLKFSTGLPKMIILWFTFLQRKHFSRIGCMHFTCSASKAYLFISRPLPESLKTLLYMFDKIKSSWKVCGTIFTLNIYLRCLIAKRLQVLPARPCWFLSHGQGQQHFCFYRGRHFAFGQYQQGITQYNVIQWHSGIYGKNLSRSLTPCQHVGHDFVSFVTDRCV